MLAPPRCGGTQRRGSGRSDAPSSGGDSLTLRGFRPDVARSRRSSGRGCLACVSAPRPTPQPSQAVPIMCCSSTSDFVLSSENTDPEAPTAHNRTQHIEAVSRVGERRPAARHVLARLAWFPPAATSNRACGSPAHGSPTFFTAGIQRPRRHGRLGRGATMVPPRLISPIRSGD
jgi:hypothetical protein